MLQKNTYIFISSLIVSLLMLLPTPALAQYGKKKAKIVEVPDTVPFFNGLSVSYDLFGTGQMIFGDYGQYEGAVSPYSSLDSGKPRKQMLPHRPTIKLARPM